MKIVSLPRVLVFLSKIIHAKGLFTRCAQDSAVCLFIATSCQDNSESNRKLKFYLKRNKNEKTINEVVLINHEYIQMQKDLEVTLLLSSSQIFCFA